MIPNIIHDTIRILFLLCLLSLAAAVQAIEFPDRPLSSTFIVDEAGLINQADQIAIDLLALSLLEEEDVPVVIVTIPSLEDYEADNYSIEIYAQKLFDEWGIGSQERNYGILLLVSDADRKARIELGESWAGKYNTQAQKIMDDLIIPNFKKGNFSLGILKGVEGLNALARGLELPKQEVPVWFYPALIAVVVLIIAITYSLFRSGKSGWAWAFLVLIATVLFFIIRNSGKDSSDSFKGGSSGGGGASGSW